MTAARRRRLQWPRALGAAGLALFVLAAAPVSERLSDAQEQRARALMREIACLVCEGQSIGESDAPVAQAMRAEVEAYVLAGLDDDGVRAAIANDYGPEALMRPGFEGGGVFLWLAPLGLIVLGAGVARIALGPKTGDTEADKS